MTARYEEVVRVAALGAVEVPDHEALDEIEMCGDLMIAASASDERLTFARIDEVLKVERSGVGDLGLTARLCRAGPRWLGG